MPPVMVGVQVDRLERFIAHDPLPGGVGCTYEAPTPEQLIGRLQAAGVDLARVVVACEGIHAPSSADAEELRVAIAQVRGAYRS